MSTSFICMYFRFSFVSVHFEKIINGVDLLLLLWYNLQNITL